MSISVSPKTIEVLKNFLSINKSIVLQPGNIISTLSVNKNIMARCVVDEEFPEQAAIYDLSVFIGALNLCGNPILDFSNTRCLMISDSATKSKSKIYYSDPDMIVSPPDKDLDLTTTDVEFNLGTEELKRLQQAANTYGVQDLCLYGADGKMNICVTDKKNDTSNVYSIELGDTDSDFCYCFKMENLRLISETYKVSIHMGKVALFQARNGNLKYWIALEPNVNN
jgi:hypothetical protein